MKFPIKDFFSRYDQILRLLPIWPNLLKKSSWKQKSNQAGRIKSEDPMNMHWKWTTNQDASKEESKSSIDLTVNNQLRCKKSQQLIKWTINQDALKANKKVDKFKS